MVDIFDTSFDENKEIEISDNKAVKGDEINLREIDPTMTKVVVAVGWHLNAFETDTTDVDISAFLLNSQEKTRVDEDFVFYNNLETCDGGIVHNGDNVTGAGDGDDETIAIDFEKIPFDVNKIVFVFSIYRGEEKEQSLENIRKGYLRLLHAESGQEILRYEISDDVKDAEETAMFVGSLNREGPKWHFVVLGEPAKGGLAKIATDYDIIVHKG